MLLFMRAALQCYSFVLFVLLLGMVRALRCHVKVEDSLTDEENKIKKEII